MEYKERDERKRAKYLEELEKIPKEKRIYIDESWIDHNETKTKSWSPVWKPTKWKQNWQKWWRTTIIAWVRGKEVLAPFRFEWTTNTQVFNLWIKEYLLLDLKEWDVVILDNASFHKSVETIKLIESVWAKILFLPPYSPDLNPIEQYWAVLKAYVRKFNISFDTFLQILDSFLNNLMWWFAS